MFFMHITFSLELLVVIAGFLLFLKAKKHNAGFVKIISIIIILVSVASVLCSAYCALRFWQTGTFPMQTRMQMMNKMDSAQTSAKQ